MTILMILALVYLGGVVWPKIKSSGAAPMDWAWPVRLVLVGWNKLFGAD